MIMQTPFMISAAPSSAAAVLNAYLSIAEYPFQRPGIPVLLNFLTIIQPRLNFVNIFAELLLKCLQIRTAIAVFTARKPYTEKQAQWNNIKTIVLTRKNKQKLYRVFLSQNRLTLLKSYDRIVKYVSNTYIKYRRDWYV